jgi:hypothetical protein
MLTHEEAIATINGVRDEVGYPGIDFNKLIRNYFSKIRNNTTKPLIQPKNPNSPQK